MFVGRSKNEREYLWGILFHFYSIKDTRTRVIKDYYIEQIKAVKGRVATFFHTVAFGKSSFNKVVSWYEHVSIDIKGIDKGVRKSLDLQIAELSDVLDRYYGEITNWEDYNNQYSSSHLSLIHISEPTRPY